MEDTYRTEDEYTPWQLYRVEALFFRMLLRALADLQDPDINIRNSAVRWFQADVYGLPDFISYKDVVDNLDIGCKLMARINRDICSYGIDSKKIA